MQAVSAKSCSFIYFIFIFKFSAQIFYIERSFLSLLPIKPHAKRGRTEETVAMMMTKKSSFGIMIKVSHF